MKRVVAAAAGSLAAMAPSVALACPVCFAAKDEANRIAFLGTTVLLTSLPVLMIGSIIYWIARRSHALSNEDGEQPEGAALEAGRAGVRQPEAAPGPRQGDLIPLRRGQ